MDGLPLVLNGQQRWVIGERLAAGGFGEVFTATRLGEDEASYVVKFVSIEPGAERELLYQATPGVRNVVPLVDFGQSGNKYFMIMPRAELSLHDHISPPRRLPISEVLDIGYDIGVALVDLTGKLVHRDLKPGNILRLNSSWCLADFGIAGYTEASTSPNTRKFAISPMYAAPERWRNESTSSATDIYSLGATLYQCLVGQPPFRGPTIEDFENQHLHSNPPSVQSDSPLLNSLVTECLYKSKEARPNPSQFLERISGLNIAPNPAFDALRVAQERVASEDARAQLLASLAQSEDVRRQMLEEAANTSFLMILHKLASGIREAAPSARIQHSNDNWIASLGNWSISMSSPQTASEELWTTDLPAPFDVICYSAIRIHNQDAAPGGFSHSIWYCNPNSSYAWYELAFSSRIDLATSALLPYRLARWPNRRLLAH